MRLNTVNLVEAIKCNWNLYYKYLFCIIVESYDKVRFKLKLAELESDVATGMSNESDDSDVENTRKSKRKKRYINKI